MSLPSLYSRLLTLTFALGAFACGDTTVQTCLDPDDPFATIPCERRPEEASSGSGGASGGTGGSFSTGGAASGGASSGGATSGGASSGGAPATGGTDGTATGGALGSGGEASGGEASGGAASGDDYDCDPRKIVCVNVAPVEPCGPGLSYSVVDGCYGACVPTDSCRCTDAAGCDPLDPEESVVCNEETSRCQEE